MVVRQISESICNDTYHYGHSKLIILSKDSILCGWGLGARPRAPGEGPGGGASGSIRNLAILNLDYGRSLHEI